MIDRSTTGRPESTAVRSTSIRVLACLLVLGTLDAPAWSQDSLTPPRCSAGIAASVANNVGIKLPAVNDDNLSAATCKQWPYQQDNVLSAFAFDQGTEGQKTFVVAIVDGRTGKVRSSYKRRVEEDALVEFGSHSLAIDTAPYQLAKNLRAFGVRFNSAARGASCPDAAWSDELTLFVPAGSGLRPVLHGLPMSRYQADSGCLGNGPREPIYDEAKLFLNLATTRSHGFRDLLVRAKITRIEKGGRKKPAKTESYLLRYNGQTYEGAQPAPWWFSSSPLGE